MSSVASLIPPKNAARNNVKGIGRYSYELNNNTSVALPSRDIQFSTIQSPPAAAVSPRKQRYPQPSVADDDDEEVMSNMSDSEEEDPNTLFTYKPPATGETDKCDWCAASSTHRELCLVTQDRHTKSFCSEDCQQLYKNNVLSTKICQWCRQHFPNEPSLIVVEPSMESVPLQFCSQSCINKYKMELFCEEVKEQLRRIKEDKIQLPNMIPAKSARSEKKILITPELWSKGESTVVYIDEMSETGSTNYSSNKSLQQPNDRKRKGSKMENVISKLSRRQFPKMEYETERDETPKQSHVQRNESSEQRHLDGQSVPINLSLYRTSTPNYKADNSQIGQILRHSSSVEQNQRKVQDMTSATAHKPLIVPVPMFIPIPIPIPIPTCLTALSQAFRSQNNRSSSQAELPSSANQRRDMSNIEHTLPNQEKRYILKKEPLPDAPE